jgi:hypothetical protein
VIIRIKEARMQFIHYQEVYLTALKMARKLAKTLLIKLAIKFVVQPTKVLRTKENEKMGT